MHLFGKRRGNGPRLPGVRARKAVVAANFDPQWYRSAYADVATAGVSPLKHYLRHGWRESRRPTPDFDVEFYKQQYLEHEPDTEPFAHYLLIGKRLGHLRSFDDLVYEIISQAFDKDYYLREYQDVAASKTDPVAHYITIGAAQGRNPGPEFDTSYYVKRYKDLQKSGLNPFFHYLQHGRDEGRFGSGRAVGRIGDYVFTHATTQDRDGVVGAKRICAEKDYTIKVPFPSPVIGAAPRIAVFIHAFHVDIFSEIISYLSNIQYEFNLFVTTDTLDKQREIEQIVEAARLRFLARFACRVVPNRGRDIAPKLIGFSEEYARHDVFLHLHTKRSVHLDDIAPGWRDHILGTILGSSAIVGNILKLLAAQRVGIVFGEHYEPIKDMLNWGYDFDIASGLLGRLGLQLDVTMELEFPSGSMFWGRTSVLRPLVSLGLRFEDFHPEDGQIDGTLAHAIERAYLFIAEASGHSWVKISTGRMASEHPETRVTIDDQTGDEATGDATTGLDRAVGRALGKVTRSLLYSTDAGMSAIAEANPELRAFSLVGSSRSRPRLNLVVPTVNVKETFGGVATALRLFIELIADCPELDGRVIVTDAPLADEIASQLQDYKIVDLDGYDDDARLTVVKGANRRKGPLTIRQDDFFMATAWWTAVSAFRFQDAQRRFFGRDRDVIYLIQDFEPNFHGWASQWVLAENTYKYPDRTIAVFNSEELHRHMTRRYKFATAYCLKYEINKSIAGHFNAGAEREPLILIYGRPTVARNGYEIIVDGLHLWQQRHPSQATAWKIVSLGETIEKNDMPPLLNFECEGKVSLEQYAHFLNRASIGVSLMFSPHPSYPPLEMAEAGLVTITNTFEDKDLALRSSNIISIDIVDAPAIADALQRAFERLSTVGGGRGTIADPTFDGAYYSSAALARLIRAAIAPAQPSQTTATFPPAS